MQNTIIKSIVSLGLSCLSLSVLAAAAPQQPVDKNQCFGCHATAIKTLSTRGAHKNVNCVACHDISPDHVKAPSRDNRPDYAFRICRLRSVPYRAAQRHHGSEVPL